MQPNSIDSAPKQQPQYAEPPLTVQPGTMDKHDHRIDEDYYSQPRALFNLMKADQKQLLIDNIVGSMKGIDRAIQLRQLAHFYKVHPEYGGGIAKGLDIDINLIK